MQNHTFGRRTSPSFADTLASSSAALPIKIEKELGIKASILICAVLWVIFSTTLPLLLQKGALNDVLFHSNSPILDLGAVIAALALYLLSRNPGELEISAQGIRVATKSGRWFYNWSDVERAVETPKGVKLILRGRSDEQNLYNIISNDFGLKTSELSSIVTEGISRFGATPDSSIKTVSPGDDLQAMRIRAAKQLLGVMGIVLGGLFAAVVVWQVLGCLKNLDLQKSGRATEARVIRTYTSGCGKSGCIIKVEYAFTPEPVLGRPRIEYRGYENIGNSRRPNDPDLAYAKAYRTVPIVYDVNKPTVSGLNFRNRVFAKNPVSVMFQIIGIFAGIEGVIIAIVVAASMPVLWKARKAALNAS